MSADDHIKRLEAKIEELEQRVQVTEDVNEIRNLQYLYGYLIDKCMYDETVDLFTENCEVHFHGGIFKGKAGASRLYKERFRTRFTYDTNGPVDGFLLDHPQIQPIIHVMDDGVTAKARARSMMQAGRHVDFGDPRQWWEGGIYENTYKKVDCVWRIHILNYNPLWHADFDKGWAYTQESYVPFLSETYPDDPSGPDELKPEPFLWPTHKVVPFHMKHPVTGKDMIPERWQGDIDRETKKS